MQNDIKKYEKKFRSELFDSIEPFWTRYGMDRKYGGMTTCLDRQGNVYSTDKSVWMQGRAAYMYSLLLCDNKNNTAYRSAAESCLHFLDNYCFSEDGRMYFTVTKDGRPLRKRRYFFSETFYIIACAQYYLATGNVQYLEKAQKYYRFVIGLYTGEIADPYKITPKTIPSTRVCRSLAEPMILLNVTQVIRDADPELAEYYDDTAKYLMQDIFQYFYRENSGLLMETVGKDGETDSEVAAYRVVNPGHSLEASWFILKEAMRKNDREIVRKAEKIFNAALGIGWDREYGGIFYFKDFMGKPVEAYEHDMKLWWPHNEAVNAALMLYCATGQNRYAEWFEKLADYAFSAFSDPQYGEWFGYLRRDGKPTEPPCKGHTYKGFFHVARMLQMCSDLLQKL